MAKAGKAYSKQSVKKTGRERKEKLVAGLVEKIDASNGLVFTDYKGITHQQLEALRKELKKVDSSLVIAKNSLMKIGLGKSKNFADYKDNEALEGPAATLIIGKDSIEPLKKLQKSIKDTGLPTVKFGVLEGQLLDEAGVLKLASLPGREVLLAQFVGLLNAPIQRFVTGLNAIPQKFVMTLDAIAKNKPTIAPSAPPEPTPAEPTSSDQTPPQDQATKSEEAEAKVETSEPVEPETPDESKEEKPETDKSENAVQTDKSTKPADEEQIVDSAGTEEKSKIENEGGEK
jgi:large subunit ribosomal protein L10